MPKNNTYFNMIFKGSLDQSLSGAFTQMQGGANKTNSALNNFTQTNKKLDQTLSAATKQGAGALKTFRKLESAYIKEKNALAVLIKKKAILKKSNKTGTDEYKSLSQQIITTTAKVERQQSRLKSADIGMRRFARSSMQAKKGQRSLQGAVHKTNGEVNRLSKTMGKFKGLAIGALGGFGVGKGLMTAATLERSLAEVNAVAGIKGDSTSAAIIKATANTLGRSTEFNSSEVAQGMKFLAQAGYGAEQIEKTMPAMLDLALAGNTDLASTADITSNIMSAFGLSADKATMASDMLTKTFTTSNVDLRMLGETMKYVAPKAKSLGISMAETSAMAGVLGDSGIQGTQAGTALRAIMTRLAAPVAMGENALNDLGVSTKDDKGNLRNLVTIMSELSTSMQERDLGSAERESYIKDIFGVEASTAISTLFEKVSSDGLQQKIKLIQNSQGTTAKIAKEMSDNLTGSWRGMMSAVEGLSNSIFEPFLVPLKSALTYVAGLTNQFTQFIDKASGLKTALGLALAALGGFVTFLAGKKLLGAVRGLKGLLSGGKGAAGGFTRLLGGKPLPVYVVNGGVGGLGGKGKRGRAGRMGKTANLMRSGFSSYGGSGLARVAKGFSRSVPMLGTALSVGSLASSLSQDNLNSKQIGGAIGDAGGALSGALAGGAAGALAGSIVPVVGTAIGGVLGSIGGAIGGSSLGSWLGETVGGWFSDDEPEKPKLAQIKEPVKSLAAANSQNDNRTQNITIQVNGGDQAEVRKTIFEVLEEQQRKLNQNNLNYFDMAGI